MEYYKICENYYSRVMTSFNLNLTKHVSSSSTHDIRIFQQLAFDFSIDGGRLNGSSLFFFIGSAIVVDPSVY